ncbi:Uncharacterised protein [Mycobacteroides abscessus subsp. massiliense]|uniref:hypothetical protein n=1 Tax=Mycobacteroides abscessus TaxID=36809 RepID=UPI0009A60EE9|nr:hypothetical protein [Mycobacteroides abscessus]SLI77029.1 Uncharacterised protein [Mycobacteroides abscessus subsp. massiliense]
MGKLIGAAALAFLGLGLIGDYPIVGFGMLAAAGLLVWMGMQGRQSVRVERARPTAARQARQEVQSEVNRAQRDANRNLASAVQRVEREQRERWVA